MSIFFVFMGIFFVASCSSWKGFSGKFQNILHCCILNRDGAPLFSAIYFDDYTMQMRKCLYVDLSVCVYIFVYKYIHVLYTHAHDMRVYIWTGSAGAFADGKFRHKDEKEGRIRNTDNDRDRYSDRLHYPFWRPGFLVCRLSWLVWAVCKKLSLIVIRLWSFWVWPFWRSRTIKRHLLPCPVGISIKTTILTLVACGEWSIDHEYVRRVKDWGTV